MSLQDFDALIDRMKLAFEYADNLGQYVEAAKVLYQMNDQLPDDLQLTFEELDDPEDAKSFVKKYYVELKSAIVSYRQKLMNF
ncbi:hypothetical protein [Candidatus Nitrosopumilus sediminis]|uniref:Uncharacterized protein n=1 Tax=Candidatus Nitrosopumilus sediminis TaxID=1229909 RepID=K0BC99_9ARCH|nr:hypothetical protein [Candidatus Nitrosopumilus sediminis]AFS83104.1 hypothetical protein NSED_06520 [Candidatus Nitrosopumilus sediminis]